MKYYILLTVGALCFAVQFLCTKQYQKKYGQTVSSAAVLIAGAGLSMFVFFFVKGCISARAIALQITPLTALLSFVFAVCFSVCVYLGIRILSVGKLSLYSVFVVLGGIILPSVTGLLFFGETAGTLKIIAFIVVLLAVSVPAFDKSEGGRSGKSAILLYLLIFVANGLATSVNVIHQNFQAYTVRFEDNHIAWCGLWLFALGLASLLILRANGRNKSKKIEGSVTKIKTRTVYSIIVMFILPLLFGVLNGVGNYLVLLCTSPNGLGAVITFSFINGGIMIFSSVLSRIVFKEKITLPNFISLFLAITATILFVL